MAREQLVMRAAGHAWDTRAVTPQVNGRERSRDPQAQAGHASELRTRRRDAAPREIRRPQRDPDSVRTAASVPSRRTWAASRRPDVQRASSPGGAGDRDHRGARLGGDPDPALARVGGDVVADQFHADRGLAQDEPGHAEPPPQGLGQGRGDLPLRPAGRAAPDVLVVHEELDEVDPLVHARQPRTTDSRGGPLRMALIRPSNGFPLGQPALHPPGVPGERADHDARPRVRPAFPQHQVGGQIEGGPAVA